MIMMGKEPVVTDYTAYDGEGERWVQVTFATGLKFEGYLKEVKE